MVVRGGGAENFRQLLEILEVDTNNLHAITEPMKFQNVILPDESFFIDDSGKPFENQFFSGNTVFAQEYLDTIEIARNYARKKFTPLSQKKFYIYHGGSNQIGEQRLAEYFKSKGYAIIQPEKFTLDEQLNIFLNCESFVSTLGSASHNAIFLKDNSEVILIPRWVRYNLNTYQEAINRMHNLQVSYIDATLSLGSPGIEGAYLFIISEQLKKFFGDAWTGFAEEDLVNFLEYQKYCQAHGLPIFDTPKKYYSGVLNEILAQLKQREDLLQKFGIKI